MYTLYINNLLNTHKYLFFIHEINAKAIFNFYIKLITFQFATTLDNYLSYIIKSINYIKCCL